MLSMQGYKHILARGEIDSGRIYISDNAKDEFMRQLGLAQGRPFNIFRSDNKILLRSVVIQKRAGKAGLRINFGQDTSADCTEGTAI
jgi:hypothetical protein